jgi:hypothetical protein
LAYNVPTMGRVRSTGWITTGATVTGKGAGACALGTRETEASCEHPNPAHIARIHNVETNFIRRPEIYSKPRAIGIGNSIRTASKNGSSPFAVEKGVVTPEESLGCLLDLGRAWCVLGVRLEENLSTPVWKAEAIPK